MTKALPRVRNTVARRAADDMRAARLNVPQLLKEAEIKPSLLSQPDGWLHYDNHARLLEIAAKMLNDPLYGVKLATRIPPSEFGAIAYVGLASTNLGEALQNLARYFHVHSEAWLIEMLEVEQVAKLSFTPILPRFAQYHKATETGLSLLLNAYHHFLGQRLVPVEIDFTHAPEEGKSQDEWGDAFGCPVRFRQNRVQMTLSRAALELPITTADSRLLGILKEHCVNILKRSTTATDSIVDRVRSAIIGRLTKGKCTAQWVGKELGLPERTLHRKLAEANTSYKEIIDDLRRTLAQKYLQEENLSLKQTAFLLGYSDPSAFSAAYRRWTGSTPRSKSGLHPS